MKKLLPCLLSVCLAVSAIAAEKQYEEVEFSLVKAAPESFSSNRRIVYEAPYFRYMTTFLPYMEKSGFKPSRHYLLEIGHRTIPAMLKKSKETNELIASLRRGTVVKVYGRVKKFRSKPLQTLFPHYYVDVERIGVEESAAPSSASSGRSPVNPRLRRTLQRRAQ